jgi:hypothetical protein
VLEVFYGIQWSIVLAKSMMSWTWYKEQQQRV